MSYATEVAADAPLVWWRLGETSGTAAQDATANNIDGTYGGAFTLGQTGLVGDADKAVLFGDGAVPASVAADDLTLGGIGANFTTSSWELCVKGTDTGNWGPLLSTGWWEVDYNAGTNTLGLFAFDDATGDVEGTVSSVNLHDGQPHHLVFVIASSTTFAVYVDGVSKSVTYTSQVALVTNPAFTGFRVGGGTAQPLTYDEFAAYPTRLSGARIAAHAAAGGGGGGFTSVSPATGKRPSVVQPDVYTVGQ